MLLKRGDENFLPQKSLIGQKWVKNSDHVLTLGVFIGQILSRHIQHPVKTFKMVLLFEKIFSQKATS